MLSRLLKTVTLPGRINCTLVKQSNRNFIGRRYSSVVPTKTPPAQLAYSMPATYRIKPSSRWVLQEKLIATRAPGRPRTAFASR